MIASPKTQVLAAGKSLFLFKLSNQTGKSTLYGLDVDVFARLKRVECQAAVHSNCSLSFTNTSTFCKEFPLKLAKREHLAWTSRDGPGKKLSYCWVVARTIKRVSALLKKTPTMKGRSSWSLVCKPAWCRCKRPEQDTTKPVNWRMSHNWHLKLLGKW